MPSSFFNIFPVVCIEIRLNPIAIRIHDFPLGKSRTSLGRRATSDVCTASMNPWRVENRDVTANHASTCTVELLRTCSHAFILHRASTLNGHAVCVRAWVRTSTLLPQPTQLCPSHGNHAGRCRSNFRVPFEHLKFKCPNGNLPSKFPNQTHLTE